MAETKSPAKQWTEAEKLSILFQLIEKVGSKQLDEITLPEGRTKKAVSVMLDKEKQKMRKARAEELGEGVEAGRNGEVGGEKKSKAKGKRKADEEADGAERAKKTPKKSKAKAAAAVEGDEVGEATAEAVKEEKDD